MVAILLAVSILQADGMSDAFTLARNGKPSATIVIADRPTTAAAFAARELQDHVKLITGVTLPTATDSAEVKGLRILVGESAATRKLGINADDFKGQEYAILFRPDTIALIGKNLSPEADPTYRVMKWVPGKFGTAIEFDGKTDSLTVTESGFSDDAGSMEAWVRLPSEPQEEEATLLRYDSSSPWTYQILSVEKGTHRFSYRAYDGVTGAAISSAEMQPGWHHVLAAWNASDESCELFVDGLSQGKSRYPKTVCRGCKLQIGACRALSDPITNRFRGAIDEVRISRISRKPPAVFTSSAPTADADTTLLLHFDEGSGWPRLGQRDLDVSRAPGFFTERGDLDATYEFLERFCGVRWYHPGETGTVYPTSPTLTIKGRDVRRVPDMKYTWIAETDLFIPKRGDRIPYEDTQLWKLRMRMGGDKYGANHSLEGYSDRFLKTHPDWFAQGYGDKPSQLCYTNPELIKQVVQDTRDFFDGKGLKPGAKGMGDFFAVVPMDTNAWCRCPKCQALLGKDDIKSEYFFNGKSSNYIWGFVNEVAKELKRTHPDKYIAALSYSDYSYYPSSIELEPNIAAQLCLTNRQWCTAPTEKNNKMIFREWTTREKGRPIYLWLYWCFPALLASTDGFNAFPAFYSHTIVRQMAMYHKAGIKGIFMEHSSEFAQSHLLDLPDIYVTVRMARDARLDGNALINEFFDLYYGSAAKPMKELCNRIEDTYSDQRNYPADIRTAPKDWHQTEAVAWGSLGTPERMVEFAKLMDKARAAAKTDIEKRRVAMFEEGVWQCMVDGQKCHKSIEARKKMPLPKLVIRRTPDAGGDPSKVDWSQAFVLDNWCRMMGDPTSRKITGRVIHDGKRLYVELQEDMDTSKLLSSSDIAPGDDWEVFFAAKREKPYRQIMVSPEGKHIELAYGEDSAIWDCGAAVTSNISSPTRWLTRLSIPLENLIPGGVKPGGTFYANFYRGIAWQTEFLAWSPNFVGSFHELGRLGEIILE